MKINKLKAISIAVCCLVASLWSEAQCMDNQKDILESATVNRTANIQSSSQNEIEDLAFESTPSQLISLEDSETSWASYLISPVKTTFQMVSEFISSAHNKPQKAMFVGLLLASQITLAASEYVCTCYTSQINYVISTGVYPNQALCVGDCHSKCIGFDAQLIYWNCPLVNKA
jgi:hypothetical protein